MSNTEKSPHSRIKWLLFAGGVLVAVAYLLLYQRPMRLVDEIEATDGWVRTENVGPVWLRQLVGDELMSGFDTIHSVSLKEADDAWLRRLGRLSNLQSLSLTGTQISDEGLKHLAGLSNLESLDLRGTQISDDGLKHLAGLRSLERLYLTDTQISDDGLKHLAGLTSLNELHLDGTQISDDGLKHLTGLFTLEYLDLRETQVTDDGVKELQQALPNCHISR